MLELLAVNLEGLEDVFGWGSPLGLAVFFVGAGLFIYLLSKAGKDKRGG